MLSSLAPSRRTIAILATVVALLILQPASQSFGQTPAPSGAGAGQPKTKDPSLQRLGSRLQNVVVEARTGNLAAAAQRGGVPVVQNRVKVTIETDPSAVNAVSGSLRARGAQETARYRGQIDALVSLSDIAALAATPGVRSIDLPIPIAPAVTSEALPLVNAPAWQTAQMTGAGVRIGIIDVGFIGYTSLLGTELPASVDTHCTQAPVAQGSAHGTAVAEIVHDMAPAAQLYFARITTDTELGSAADCLIRSGVSVINMSAGFMYHAAGNGTGTVNNIVADATNRGVFWANSSGNAARDHWRGFWSDGDGDGRLSFSGSDEEQTLTLFEGEVLVAGLRWNDTWGGACHDYDLYLVRASDRVRVAGSAAFQECEPLDEPLEVLGFEAPATGTYFLEVVRFAASGTHQFDLITFDIPLEYSVAAGSLLHPADSNSPGMATVGAVPYSNPTAIEPFSSQGPTTDGRIKPDLAGPDGVSTSAFGPGSFFGTSAASPHVAGAAALVKQANPSFTPAQIKNFLMARAVDIGSAGADNVFGAGRLHLGNAPVVSDFSVSCNPSTRTISPGSSNTSTCTVQSTGEFNSAVTFNCADLPAGVTCAFNPISVTPAAGGTATSTLTVSVGASVAAGTKSFSVTGTSGGTVRSTSMQVIVPANADVSVTNVDSPDPVQVNQNITYTITARNNGPSTATNVQVTDTLPAGVTFVSASVTGRRGTGCTGATTITCTLGSLTNGQTVTVTIIVRATQGGTVNNTVTISAAENDPNPGNNSATANTTVSTPTSAVVRITPATASVNPSGSVGLDVQAALSGVSLGNWTVDVTYNPSVVQASGCQPQNGSQCNTAFAANTVRITGTSAGGLNNTVTLARITFTAIGQAGASSTITPSAVTFTTPAANPISASTQNGQVTITPPSGVNLALTMTDSPDPVQAGQTLIYSLTVRNNGTATATNVVVTDTLPAGVTFVSAMAGSGRGSVSCPHSNGTVSCGLGSLAPNASTGITITVNVPAAATGTLTNSATAGSTETDANPSDNTATTSTTIGGTTVDLVLTQTDSPDPVQTGQNLTYTITVQNTGTAPASNVVVTDTLPGGVTFGSATASQGSCTGTTTVTCNLGTLAGGATATVTIVVQPTANGTLTNTAQVSMTEADPTPANNTATATTTVGTPPSSGVDLTLTITDTPDPVRPGQSLTYRLTVRNNGSATATNVVATSTLPAGVTFVSATIPSVRGGSCPHTAGTVSCALGSLAPGASIEVVIAVTVQAGASGTLTNNATTGAAQADSNAADNSATATTTVDTSPPCPRGGCATSTEPAQPDGAGTAEDQPDLHLYRGE